MSYLYFDIETIPDQSEYALDRAKESVKVPANYKNPDTIAQYIEDNAVEQWKKTALDGFSGHVICIGTNFGTFVANDVAEEEKIIRDFYQLIAKNPELSIVGHNIIGFDIPFLTKRSIVLGVKLPPEHIWPRNPKPWDNRVFDTMMQFGNGKEFIGLDKLAKSLGIKGKSVSGEEVIFHWQQGNIQAIRDYCVDDVRIVEEIHKKFLSVNW